MLRLTLWLLMAVCVRDFASCSILCPDESMCSNNATCCKTQRGYSCCPYPKAVCCSDQAHCCPPGFHCNLITQMCEKENQMWMNTRMVKKEAAERPGHPAPPASPLQELENNHVPDQQKSSIVFCDSRNYCPSGTTCCRHPQGVWFCCPYSPGRCCLDGFHCCPFGYDCDLTYQFCQRQSLRYPFSPKQAPSSIPASLIPSMEDKDAFQETPMTVLTEARVSDPEAGVIFCDSKFYCPQGRTCCKGSQGQWKCCP